MSDMGRVAIQERRTGKADHRNQDGDDLLDTALFFISHVLLSKESSNAEGIGRPAERGSGLRNVQTCPHWIVCVSGPPLELKSICQRHLTSLLGVVIPSNGVDLTWFFFFFFKYHVSIIGLLPVGLVEDIISWSMQSVFNP